jgi:hypothetical protein
MKLNWISPLNTSKSSAARMTACVLPVLQAYAKINLWVLDIDDPKLSFDPGSQVEVRKFLPHHWYIMNESDLTLFNLDSEDPQGLDSISQVARHLPGIAILHGFELASFTTGSNLHCRDRLFQNLLRMSSLGSAAAETYLKEFLKNEKDHYSSILPNSAFECLANSLGIVTHTEDSFNYVKLMNYPTVCKLNKPVFARKIVSKNEQIDSGYFRILAYQCSQESAFQLLEAIAGLDQKKSVRLEFVPKNQVFEPIQDRIYQLHLENQVFFRPDPGPHRLDELFSQLDLAIHLPPFIESFGRVSEFSLHAQNRSVPCISSGKVDFTADELSRLLSTCLKNQTQPIVKNSHSTEDYAASLMDFAKQALKKRLEFCKTSMIRTASQELGAWANDTRRPHIPPRVTQAISFLTAPESTIDTDFSQHQAGNRQGAGAGLLPLDS